MISKMLLSANEFGCSDEILTIASFLSVQVSISTSYSSFSCAIFYFLSCSDTHWFNSPCGFL
jgi:HrpA-like RNA helicase